MAATGGEPLGAPPARPTLDVIVVSYRSRATIAAALRSTRHLDRTFEVRWVVHDNAGDDELLAQVSLLADEAGIRCRLTSCPDNCGFAAACNTEARASDADFLLFLNPDAEILAVPPQWRPGPGIQGPSIVDAAGNEYPMHGRDRTVWTEVELRAGRRQPGPRGHGFISGACLLIDRPAFEALEGFDERFYMYYEDVDLGLRASAAGLVVREVPQWQVLHVGGESSGGDKTRVAAISARSALYFHRKHGHAWRLYGTAMAGYFAARTVVAPDSAVRAMCATYARTYLRGALGRPTSL